MAMPEGVSYINFEYRLCLAGGRLFIKAHMQKYAKP